MNKILLAALTCVISSTLPAQNLRVVNTASLSNVSVAPGSIVSIFGTRLTTGVSFATNAQNPPQSLGGVSVTVGGSAAALFYVSPTQINAVLNPATPTGTETVVVTSGVGTQTGSVTVSANAPPGLFSLSGAGTRDGAILNALNFQPGDFSTHTGNNPTFLALFATGLNLSVVPTVTIGGVPVTVTFAGAASCCAGLEQINVMLPDSLAGAGRVPVMVSTNGQTSNTVQIVLLPPQSAKPFPDDPDNQTRSRELASLAYVPGTSLVLSTDQNDDVVRAIDVNAKQVVHTVALPGGANPSGVAVNATGTLAAVAEVGRNKIAVINLTTFTVNGEVAVGAAPVAVAIAGSQAIAVNADDNTVSIIDLTSMAVQKTLTVGHGAFGVAADAAARKAYVTNEADGSVSVVDLAALSVTKTIALDASIRPEAIALIASSGVALVTVPAAGPEGTVLLLNLTTGATTSITANPDRSGGSSDAVYFNGKVYFANQTGGSVSVLPVNPTTGAATGAATTIKVDLGARALAIDTKDNLLVVSNEGTGTLVLVSLTSNAVVGRVDAVKTSNDEKDDHSDHDGAANAPAITLIAPVSGRAGSTFNLTITGVRLTGATAVTFGANGEGGDDHGNKNSSDFTVTNIHVSTDGTQLTAAVTIAGSAKPGARQVQVTTPNGDSAKSGGAAMFVVLP